MTSPTGRPRGRVRTPRPGAARKAGIVGAVFGLAAAGLAAGVAVERAVVRRSKRGIGDRYADEKFGELPYDESCVVTTADGTDIHVEIVEPARGTELETGVAERVTEPSGAQPTIVFVHGFCLDMGTFHFQRAELARRGEFRMVFYDQPGHGRSSKLETGEYELPALGETLRAVIDETVPDGPVILVGHSMGGMTIMAFAELYPEMFDDRVAAVVLMATSGGLVEQAKFGLPALISRVGGPLLPLVNNATRLTGPMIDRARGAASDLAWLLTRRYGFGDPRPSPALVSYVERMNSHTSVDTVARYLRTLFTHARYPALVALRDTPTLVIVGDKDMITPVTHSEEILRRLPDAEFVKVPDSGHVVMLEHADEVNAALVEFLEKITR
ncbi:Pimeloyl-ACP methyl ester carboxylesterase [Micromonospora pattaloongensis]|uniref:Pimeloyl-ACP methyl ester carboxylesterase n=1 Tax=Micromonospora pattaloongensis TaxID=405436 RepID=A0A1H3MH37_9ACTN|nr:alpha/beta hydrolase [Micromonospora pattaloongensis]SDY76002.1 Pimeloyl-ACP methyl ester carboxylesterase [Micromonospora pattaloongensis]